MSDSPPLKCRYGGCNCCEELAWLEQQLAAARAEVEALRGKLGECRWTINNCFPAGMDHRLVDLLQRIEAALKEGG